jgi:Uma2 family endonuclease
MFDSSQVRITAAEYAQLPETNLPAELIDGAVVKAPTPRHIHQKLVFRLAKQVETLAAGQGEVNIAPLDVYLDEHNVVQPDVFWVGGAESRCQLGDEGYWHGAPDLVIEVLSPGTARHDRREKFQLYEKHGAREYWLVDPEGRYAEVWTQVDGRFEYVGLFGPDEQMRSPVLGDQSLDLASVFAD